MIATMTKYHYGAIALVLIGIFLAASDMQLEDAVKEQEFKCKMVKEGTYPNVDKFYESNCK